MGTGVQCPGRPRREPPYSTPPAARPPPTWPLPLHTPHSSTNTLWRDSRGQVRSWVPQLFARRADGTALLADCPSYPDAGGERAMKAAEAVAQACADIGWTYQRLAPLDDVLAANLKWLAGYRHPRNAGRPHLTGAVLEAFTRPRPLIEGTQTVGDPIEVLPCVFHALWHGRLTAGLDTPLHERVLVGPRGWSSPQAADAGAGMPAEEIRGISETARGADTDAGGDEAGARHGETV